MVSISSEHAAQTAARLRHVIRQAQLTIFEGTYAFIEFPLDHFPSAARADALALVRDHQVWSQLVPCSDPQAERFQVFCFHFPNSVDNSGFVGWLASHLKTKFGTGLVVTCGSNERDGGIFDYWGVPAAIGQDVLEEVRSLQRPTSAELHGVQDLTLAGATMHTVVSAETGVVSAQTMLVFEQRGDMFSARYGGGAIADGYLVGNLQPNGALQFRYVQADFAGNLDTGVSTGSLMRLADGRLQLTEDFQWLTRPGGGRNVFEEPLA